MKSRAWINLKDLRKTQGWTQSETAKKLEVTQEYISELENGKRGISMRMMESIIQVFNVEYSDFYSTPLKM